MARLRSTVHASALSILVIDDDAAMRRTLKQTFDAAGYQVTVADSGTAGIRAAETSPPDLAVLELRLGDIDGIEVCRRLRSRWAYPIIVLSGDTDEQTKVEALDAGANDYITKPFSTPEFFARIRAALRSTGTAMAPGGDVLRLGDVMVDLAAHAVVVDGRLLELTPSEYTLLVAFIRNPGAMLAHDALLRIVWPTSARTAGALRMHIMNLRRKLGTGPQRPAILTLPKAGYRMVVPSAEREPLPEYEESRPATPRGTSAATG